MITALNSQVSEVQIEQRLQGLKASSIRALLILAAFPSGDISATELTEKMGQHRSTTTAQLSELFELGVVSKRPDPATINRTNPTLLYTLNPEVDLIQVCDLFIGAFPVEAQRLIAVIESRIKSDKLEGFAPETADNFEVKAASLLNNLARKVVDLTERIEYLEANQPVQADRVLPPSLDEAFQLLA
jgi:DNA-binding MarR family transcriptional regulator